MNKIDLQSQRLLLIEPSRWKAALEHAATGQAAGMSTDIYGDPLPEMEITGDGVAIIPVCGVISANLPSIYKAFGFSDTADIAADVRTAAEDSNVKAIILDVNSPGGTVTGVPELSALISEINSGGKPVFAFTESLNASAAYWISCSGAGVFATPSAEVGSIGAYIAHYDETKAFELFGVKVQLFKSGKFKGMGFPGVSLTDEQSAKMQADVDALANEFKEHVMAQRKSAKPDSMEGQTFWGKEAVTAGLVDATVANFGEAYNEVLRVIK